MVDPTAIIDPKSLELPVGVDTVHVFILDQMVPRALLGAGVYEVRLSVREASTSIASPVNVRGLGVCNDATGSSNRPESVADTPDPPQKKLRVLPVLAPTYDECANQTELTYCNGKP